MVETIEWTDAGVVMIDQRRLPLEETYVTCRTYEEVAEAIRNMMIRGAPAIGVAAAMGVALGVLQAGAADLDRCFEVICETLAATRPTAVNLFWAIERMKRVYAGVRAQPLETIRRRLVEEARLVREEDIAINRAIGRHGAPLVPDGRTVLTHCNAGALATAGYGTALGRHPRGRRIRQAHRRLRRRNPPVPAGRAPHRLGTAAGRHPHHPHHRQHGRPFPASPAASAAWWWAPTASPPTATSPTRSAPIPWPCWRRENSVPFYVAAPVSTLDLSLASGDRIPIEQRAAAEVTHVFGQLVAPAGTAVENPAFDVTPARYVTAIITEKGVARAPYEQSLRDLAGS